MDMIDMAINRQEQINPDYYKKGDLEVIDFIEAFGLGFHTGNAIKYIFRCGHKGNKIADLKKARWYVNRALFSRRVRYDRSYLQLPQKKRLFDEFIEIFDISDLRLIEAMRCIAGFGPNATLRAAESLLTEVIVDEGGE